MIRAVLFDMDGVLAFTESFYNRRRISFLRGRGIAVSADFDGTGSSDEKIWEELVPKDVALRTRLHEEYRAYSDDHPTPWEEVANPHMVETLSVLRARGVKLAICSSSYRSLIEEFLQVTGVSELLDLVMAGEECAAYKPDPDIYLKAMVALGVNSCETIVVEDSPLGIAAGVASGAFTCALAYPEGSSLDQSEAHVRIDNLLDVIDLVRVGARIYS